MSPSGLFEASVKSASRIAECNALARHYCLLNKRCLVEQRNRSRVSCRISMAAAEKCAPRCPLLQSRKGRTIPAVGARDDHDRGGLREGPERMPALNKLRSSANRWLSRCLRTFWSSWPALRIVSKVPQSASACEQAPVRPTWTPPQDARRLVLEEHLAGGGSTCPVPMA